MKKKIIAFDLDDVLCYRLSDTHPIDKYKTCQPIQNMIDIVNICYDYGHEIIIYTARGQTSFNGDVAKIYNNLYDLTINQLLSWKVKFHKLIMGKITYDLLIDDKAINSKNINKYSDITDYLNNL